MTSLNWSIYILWEFQEDNRERKRLRLFEEIIAEQFPNVRKYIDIKIKEEISVEVPQRDSY